MYKRITHAEGAFIAENATVVGDVELGRKTSVWFGAVIRGDENTISVGDGTNVQDNCVLHVSPGHSLNIGKNVTVGHGAILHGCTIGDSTLIGMGSIVMDGAKVGSGCIIGAGTLITEGKEIPDGGMAVGSPAKVIKTLGQKEKDILDKVAEYYANDAEKYFG